MTGNVIVIGSAGQLGVELVKVFTARGYRVVSLDRASLDITDAAETESRLAELDPAVVLNAAAYNQVDLAEWEPQSAYMVNGLGVRNLAVACRQLDAYFAGKLTNFDLPLAPPGTAFQRRVWHELCRIPFGQTISYGEQARRVGKKGAARAVGAANGRNPIAIIVPCHRVIGANGTLTGYGGGLDRKEWLLRHERAAACQEKAGRKSW